MCVPPWSLCALKDSQLPRGQEELKQLQSPMRMGSLCTKGHSHTGDVVTHLRVRNIKAKRSLPWSRDISGGTEGWTASSQAEGLHSSSQPVHVSTKGCVCGSCWLQNDQDQEMSNRGGERLRLEVSKFWFFFFFPQNMEKLFSVSQGATAT